MIAILTVHDIGKTYKVTGRRGRARRFHGIVGELIAVGEFTDWQGAGNRSGHPPAQQVFLDAHCGRFRVAASQISEVS